MNTFLRKVRIPVSLFLIVAILNLSIGCNYYKVRSIDELTASLSKERIQSYQKLHKYIILHTPEANYHIADITLDSTNNFMTAKLLPLTKNHMLYSSPSEAKGRYKSRTDKGVLDEVHLFINTYVKANEEGVINIPLTSLSRMDIVEPDYGRTIASYVFGAIGITVGILAIVSVIILLTKSSCPFVYVDNGNGYTFIGEMYGGAIFKPLQRDDYMRLCTLSDTTTTLKIKIANELKEVQYTDLAQLIIAERVDNKETVMDAKGHLFTLDQPVLPRKAMLNEKANVTSSVTSLDSSFCLFNDESKADLQNDLHLFFAKEDAVTSGRLILKAKNSWWLDFAFTKFTELFGSYYPTFVEKQRASSREKLMRWSADNGIPLSVYIKTDTTWELLEQIPTSGPMALRTFCVPLDLKKHKGNTVEVKISCGFLNWELDEVSMDYSEQQPVVYHQLNPESAIDQDNINCTKQLLKADQDYLVQPLPGQECVLTYQLPALKKGAHYDVYLHSNGYYEHVREYTGIPDRKLLESFKAPAAFNKFMHLLYKKMEANHHESIANVR
ncbi:MAG: hypothetical protein IPN36_05480 [Bacteroidetes bacterium]|nr:hypothetical protein [Bacteroidota bacterium]